MKTRRPSPLQQALALHQQGQLAQAEVLYRQVLQAEPRNFDALNLLGLVTLQRGQAQVAVDLLTQAIAVNPANAGTHSNRGNALQALARHGEAVASYDRALALQPDFADALYNRGTALRALGRPAEALASYDRALALRPDDAAALNNRGNALQELERHGEALASYERVLAIRPGDAEALNNRGNALQALGRYADALASYEHVLALDPAHARALYNRGIAFQALGRDADALASYERAIAARPDYVDALNNRGKVLQDLKRPVEALANYDRALMLQPDSAVALSNRANALQGLNRFAEALASCDRSLALRPDDADALSNRGNALQGLKRFAEALASYDRALALEPGHADALTNRGHALAELKRSEEALASYARALAIKPDLPFVFGAWLYTKMQLCDWNGLGAAFARLGADIDEGRPAASPFETMATPLSLRQKRHCAEINVERRFPLCTAVPAAAPGAPHERIRLGYFSADFRNHPVAVLMAGVFEHQDRNHFELIAFSFGPQSRDALRTRIAAAFDQFIEVGDRSDADVVQLARGLGIDIAVDLMGFTSHSRARIFAQRAAPVQVNYLGFPGTMGAPYMDYLIADATVIPPEHAQGYTEQIAYLPHSFQPNDATRPIADRDFTRRELGLPDPGFVFCNFNNCYKITPDDFDIWIRLLQKVEGSVLWLAGAHPTAERNLRQEAEARSVSAQRLIFKARTEMLADHLAQLRQADLFLDCRYFNAHTTASDALWAGVPLLTRPGETYASRVAASLLKAVGLPELIATSAEAYEARALELARDSEKLAALRARLAANRLTHPLFDTAGFTRHLDAAYTAMWQRHQAGLPPAVIAVPA